MASNYNKLSSKYFAIPYLFSEGDLKANQELMKRCKIETADDLISKQIFNITNFSISQQIAFFISQQKEELAKNPRATLPHSLDLIVEILLARKIQEQQNTAIKLTVITDKIMKTAKNVDEKLTGLENYIESLFKTYCYKDMTSLDTQLLDFNRIIPLQSILKKSGEYTNLFNNMIVDYCKKPKLDTPLTQIFSDSKEVFKNIDALKKYCAELHYKISLEDAFMLYSKIVCDAHDSVKYAMRLVDGKENTPQENYKHRIVSIDKKLVNDLLSEFKNNDLKRDPNMLIFDMKHMNNRLTNLTNRLELSGKEIKIDTKELEEILLKIEQDHPHQLDTFVNFLNITKTKVPLPFHRLNSHIYTLATRYKDSTIKNCFAIEDKPDFINLKRYRNKLAIKCEKVNPAFPPSIKPLRK